MRQSLWAVGLVLLSGCAKDSDTLGFDSGGVSAFDVMIGIFEESCGAACHTGGASFGGLALDAGVAQANLVDMPSAGDSSWIRVMCGDAEQSALYQKLFRSAPFGDPMPLGVSLSEGEIDVIRAWIESEDCGA